MLRAVIAERLQLHPISLVAFSYAFIVSKRSDFESTKSTKMMRQKGQFKNFVFVFLADLHEIT